MASVLYLDGSIRSEEIFQLWSESLGQPCRPDTFKKKPPSHLCTIPPSSLSSTLHAVRVSHSSSAASSSRTPSSCATRRASGSVTQMSKTECWRDVELFRTCSRRQGMQLQGARPPSDESYAGLRSEKRTSPSSGESAQARKMRERETKGSLFQAS